jgi:hypothetical protein
MEQLIKQEMGKYLPSEEIVDHELDMGGYIIFIDGLSESKIEPSMFGNFVRPNTKRGNNTTLVVTTRPHKLYEDELLKSSNWIKVTPEKLSNANVKNFEENYLGTGKLLSEKIRSVCRSTDGFYQPILIRLATIALNTPEDDIASLYESTIRQLLQRIPEENAYDQIVEGAYKLCEDTYWKDGSREIILDSENRRVIRQLVAAGILIPMDSKSKLGNEAKRYRFLHDSIQTYLTIQGKVNQRINTMELFFKLATEAFFIKDVANFLFDEGSEIFQIGVLVYLKYNNQLLIEFRNQLKEWAAKHKGEFSSRDVDVATPLLLKDFERIKNENPEMALLITIDICMPKISTLSELFHNFSRIVFKIENTGL